MKFTLPDSKLTSILCRVRQIITVNYFVVDLNIFTLNSECNVNVWASSQKLFVVVAVWTAFLLFNDAYFWLP